MKVKKFLWLPILLILIVIYITNIYYFLSRSHPIDADILVVEGWLPPELLNESLKEFKSKDYKLIASTGVPYLPEFRMPYSGSLIFDVATEEIAPNKNGSFEIGVNVYSTPVKNEYAQMHVIVNDSIIIDVTTTAELQKYSTQLSTDSISSLVVYFTNDAYENGEDRDLVVTDVTINGKVYLPRSKGVIYDIGKPGGNDVYSANYHSVAEEAALIFQKKGIEANKIVAIPTTEREINRTYNSALAFGEWLNKYPEKGKIKGINVISMGTHSRRSWILFKKHIDDDIPVGIISLKNKYTPNEEWWKTTYGIKRVLLESVKYVYTLFL